ncbi:MAG: leucyl aminopeptidase [Dehalococcoidia bacterium]|nr:leucyl aminopeptidase [Dehalococcoidia bacterium]MDD5493433.1 leucyl aminopeptidase [Dehalococcoidia bacterium]
MKFDVKTGDICAWECDAVVVNLFEGVEKPGGATGAINSALGGAIVELIKNGEIKGELHEVHIVHSLGKIPARIVAVAGLGKKENFNADKIRTVMGDTVRTLKKHNCRRIATIIHGAGIGGIEPGPAAQAIVEGCLLGSYTFNKHVTKKEEEHDIEKIILLERDKAGLGMIKSGVNRGVIYAEAAIMTRDMVNEPANHMTPTHMAEIAEKIAEECGLESTIFNRKEMEKAGMGALLGVAQGTSQPPKFIVLSYRGNNAGKDTIGFVGKGLTFDSGGLSLKGQEFMSDMKGDMSGGAAVIAAIGAIARLKLKVNVTAVIPATENLPGGRALKPGDVLRTMNGKTIEVVNTDAEGRLILSDALSYAVKNGLSPIIDMATLTGACHVALGDLYAGVFTNDQSLVDRLIKAGAEEGENLWQLPMPEEYEEQNKSEIADIKNSGGRYGGAITGALFLKQFIADTPWVHMDIAGPFMSEKASGVLVKGATGFGVRTLISFAEKYAGKGG